MNKKSEKYKSLNNIQESLNEDIKKQGLVSNGIYSVLHNKWIKEPVQQDIPDIDKEEFEKEFEKWEDKYFEIMAKHEFPLDESLHNKGGK